MTNESCRGVEAWLDQGQARRDAPPPAPVSEHMERCPSCRNLWTWFGRDGTLLLPESTIAKLQHVLPPTIPVDPLSALSRRILGFMLILLGLSLVYSLIWGLGAFGRMNAAQSMVAAGALVCAGLLVSASLARQMEPGAAMPVAPMHLVFFLIVAYAAITALVFPWRQPPNGLSRGLVCWFGGVVLSAPAAVLARLMVRRSVVLVPGIIGATAGTLAAMTGLALLQFACLQIDAPHRLWHAAVLPAGTAIGYVVCRVATARLWRVRC